MSARSAPVLLLGGVEHHQVGRLHLGRHVGQHYLHALVFSDGLAEGLALLGVSRGFFQRGPRHTEAAGGNIDAAQLQPAHYLVEPLALLAADQIPAGYAVVLEGQLAGIHALVAQLRYVPHHVEARPLLGDEDADAAPGRVGVRVGLGDQGEGVAVAPVGNQALGPVYHVFVAFADGASLDGLDVAARVWGSVMQMPPRFSPVAIRGRNRSFCSSVPWVVIM